MSNFVYIKNKFVIADEANVSYNNRGLNYGDGFFETIKVYNHKMLFWNLHFERIVNTLKVLQLECIELLQLEDLIQQLCIKNECKGGARIKILFTRVFGGLYTPSKSAVDIIISCEEIANELYTHKIIENIAVYNEWTKSNSKYDNLKTTNALLYVMASEYAKQNNLNDVFVKNANGNIIETSNTNLFVVKDEVLYTPMLSEGCLDGVFRKFLSRNASALDVKIIEQELTEEFVLNADEVFTTNVVRGISSVNGFGGKVYANDFASSLLGRVNKLCHAERSVASSSDK